MRVILVPRASVKNQNERLEPKPACLIQFGSSDEPTVQYRVIAACNIFVPIMLLIINYLELTDLKGIFIDWKYLFNWYIYILVFDNKCSTFV